MINITIFKEKKNKVMEHPSMSNCKDDHEIHIENDNF
jgi:hypothetical protein